MLAAKDRLIVALDVDTVEKAEKLVAQLKDHVGMFKVGMELYNSVGPEILRRLHALGGKIFLDLKFHDIPNTVGQAAEVVTGHGVYMFNLHASGGQKMMRAALEKSSLKSRGMGITKPLIIAVTILTSMDQATLENEIGINKPIQEQVVTWAKLAQKSGLNGVVASPLEIKAIREACGDDFVIVTPGVRPTWAATNDQKRVMTPKEAVQSGATYLVVGRPITANPKPADAAKRILEEMEEGLNA